MRGWWWRYPSMTYIALQSSVSLLLGNRRSFAWPARSQSDRTFELWATSRLSLARPELGDAVSPASSAESCRTWTVSVCSPRGLWDLVFDWRIEACSIQFAIWNIPVLHNFNFFIWAFLMIFLFRIAGLCWSPEYDISSASPTEVRLCSSFSLWFRLTCWILAGGNLVFDLKSRRWFQGFSKDSSWTHQNSKRLSSLFLLHQQIHQNSELVDLLRCREDTLSTDRK